MARVTSVLAFACLLVFAGLRSNAQSSASTCYGTPARGRLAGGVKLPESGPNFRAYSDLGAMLGRTYVHSRVREVVVAAYAALAVSHPQHSFVYGETGWEQGGSFRPHRTHQNGLSVDFMVPVLDDEQRPMPLSTHLLNGWGYGVDFDDRGRAEELVIDFEAVGAHLAALRDAARARNVGISKVIFAPALRRRLRRTAAWPSIRGLSFSKRPVWVRHDDHFHVDFRVGCAEQ